MYVGYSCLKRNAKVINIFLLYRKITLFFESTYTIYVPIFYIFINFAERNTLNITLIMHTKEEILNAFSRLLDIQDELRQKCPWDNKQTNESLRPHTIEEVYELADAIQENNPAEIQKEMGDVMEHLVFYAMIGREKGLFDMADVLTKEADKLVFRHPHIYGDVKAKDSDDVSKIWEQVKQKEKDGNKTVLSGVPHSLPSLIKAYRIQDKARNVGFDWDDKEDVWEKVFEEIGEFKEELNRNDMARAEEELGDLIFSIVNAARLYHINPDNALENTNRKFISRFNYIERVAKEQGRNIKDLPLEEMDKLWDEAKSKNDGCDCIR